MKMQAVRLGRWGAVLAILIAAVAELRQSEVFYPLAVPFERSLYNHWTDADSDCLNTRHEVLMSESLTPVERDTSGCRVTSGRWYDPYGGSTLTDPTLVDVDHLIPLAEAHRSGAHAWSRERRAAFANDLSHPDTLIAVSQSENRSKADRDPLSWMPQSPYRCLYIQRWRDTKMRWDLQEDLLESWFISAHLWICRRFGAPGDALVSILEPG